MTEDEEIIIAGLLHDVVEDTDATIEEVRELFGDRVADIVEQVPEPIRITTRDAMIVKLADSLHNLTTTLDEDYIKKKIVCFAKTNERFMGLETAPHVR